MVVVGCLKKDEGLGHPFVSDLASESDDEFDEVCLSWFMVTCLCLFGALMMQKLFRRCGLEVRFFPARYFYIVSAVFTPWMKLDNVLWFVGHG
jgi:hypothetical protein